METTASESASHISNNIRTEIGIGRSSEKHIRLGSARASIEGCQSKYENYSYDAIKGRRGALGCEKILKLLGCMLGDDSLCMSTLRSVIDE